MSDTSAEKQPEAVVPKAEVKVPLAEVAKARADKRAARDEVDELRKENDQLKSVPALDEAMIASISEALAKEARATVEAELAPIRAEREKFKMAVQLGLNETQADKVMEIRSKNPNLTEQQALVLARAEAPSAFAGPSQSPFNPALHGGLPVGGNSPARGGGQQVDHTALMWEARGKGNQHEATMHATNAFVQRAKEMFHRNRP